jgi:hypothetical protein
MTVTANVVSITNTNWPMASGTNRNVWITSVDVTPCCAATFNVSLDKYPTGQDYTNWVTAVTRAFLAADGLTNLPPAIAITGVTP